MGDSCIKIKDYYGIEKREKCIEFKCYKIVKEYMGYNCDSVNTLTEWYLNGPKDVNWTRMTERRIKKNYTVTCGYGKAKNIDREWNSSSWDSSIISLKDFSFII